MTYDKPWLSYEEQRELLIKRGMQVDDPEGAMDWLRRVGYYRLSGYWYPLRIRNSDEVLDDFVPGARFEHVVSLYLFDCKLRQLVVEALEPIELAFRVNVSDTLGRLDPFAYENKDLLRPEFSEKPAGSGSSEWEQWLSKQRISIYRSKATFVKHHLEKYGEPLPLWVVRELWDFGSLFTLFHAMRKEQQNEIASYYGLGDGRVLVSWLRGLNHLRNNCAHYAQLWDKGVEFSFRLPPAERLGWVSAFEEESQTSDTSSFLLLLIIRQLMKVIEPESSWPERVKAHLLGLLDLSDLKVKVNISAMGAPANWQQLWGDVGQ